MVSAPAATPVTIPPVLTVATEVLLLLHVPPEVASESVMDDPSQTDAEPPIAAGNGLTVITTDLKQPVGRV